MQKRRLLQSEPGGPGSITALTIPTHGAQKLAAPVLPDHKLQWYRLPIPANRSAEPGSLAQILPFLWPCAAHNRWQTRLQGATHRYSDSCSERKFLSATVIHAGGKKLKPTRWRAGTWTRGSVNVEASSYLAQQLKQGWPDYCAGQGRHQKQQADIDGLSSHDLQPVA